MPTPPETPLSPYLDRKAPVDAVPTRTVWYVGLDLAPNEKLETGLVVLDASKRIVQADKIITDAQIVTAISQLGEPSQVVVAIDAAKSLSLESKWQQERVRLHPLQLNQPVLGSPIEQPSIRLDRFSERTWFLADELARLGCTVAVTVDALAHQHYGLQIPFRARSPQGCRALQAAIVRQLGLQGMPGNIVPVSVLEGMITAYTAWLMAHGDRGTQIELYIDPAQRLFAEPLCC